MISSGSLGTLMTVMAFHRYGMEEGTSTLRFADLYLFSFFGS